MGWQFYINSSWYKTVVLLYATQQREEGSFAICILQDLYKDLCGISKEGKEVGFKKCKISFWLLSSTQKIHENYLEQPVCGKKKKSLQI